MAHRLSGVMSIVLFVIMACAHKAAPLYKDRMNPKLMSVAALNNRHVQCMFSEAVDTLLLQPDSLSITAGHDTIEVLAAYPSLSASEIIAVTAPQSDTVYDFSGYVFDLNGNRGAFTSSFTGTSAPDTIRPWIVQYSQGYKTAKFVLSFSEMMDTSYLAFHTAPPILLAVEWENARTCRLQPDSGALHPDTTYFLLIADGVRDISNNTAMPFVTNITPDTAYRPLLLEGTVLVNDTLAADGIAVLQRTVPVGFALVENGAFRFEVRDSARYVVDILCGPYAGTGTIAVGDENVVTLEPQEKSLDSIIH